MKTKILVLFFMFFGIISCNSQVGKTDKQDMGKNKPHEEFKVNRKYDENGNLIEFDSTYTSYYSNIKGDTLAVDSIMKNFQMYFNDHFAVIGPEFNFNSDSTFHHDFFSDDFFQKQFSEQDKLMLRMMREMDSIKNQYFQMNSQDMNSQRL